jgi:hypothetical protein
MRTSRNAGASRSATAGIALLALVATACGARLDATTRADAIAGMAAGRGEIIVTNGGSTPDSGAVMAEHDQPAGAQADSDVSVVGEGSAASDHEPSGATTTTTTGPAQGAAAADEPAAHDTRSMPAGGNGGATDVGVYEDRIVLGNAVDISGAVPDIFIDAQLATQAFVEYFNNTEGTIYGRKLVLETRDTRLDAGGNREAYLDFCEIAFAAIGSMSAFDEGIVGPVQDCKLPDIRSAVVNPSTMDVESVYSSDAISSTLFPANHYLYWDEKYPGAKAKSGMMYVDNDTTKKQTRLMIAASSKIGFEWVVDNAIGLAETNYSTHALALKENGVRFVQFQGDAPQAVRLAKAMRQQNYWPDVFALQQNLYKPALIDQGGPSIENAELALGSVMNENIQHHPELQTYRQWLKRVRPSAEPTGQGSYSWGSGVLLVQLLKEIGPELTRAKLVTALSHVKNFTGNGLFPPQDVGAKVPANCHIIAKVQDGKFVPLDPPGGLTFNCRGKAQTG